MSINWPHLVAEAKTLKAHHLAAEDCNIVSLKDKWSDQFLNYK